ncbi:MAG: hypothetical protein ACR2QC_02245 [Gammaproteobacteria bacterium]
MQYTSIFAAAGTVFCFSGLAHAADPLSDYFDGSRFVIAVQQKELPSPAQAVQAIPVEAQHSENTQESRRPKAEADITGSCIRGRRGDTFTVCYSPSDRMFLLPSEKDALLRFAGYRGHYDITIYSETSKDIGNIGNIRARTFSTLFHSDDEVSVQQQYAVCNRDCRNQAVIKYQAFK